MRVRTIQNKNTHVEWSTRKNNEIMQPIQGEREREWMDGMSESKDNSEDTHVE